uniref:Uncharacterized protein n=1 Tax=Ascaris lumbricoides TaxID=6252 RepID=A0A9J2PSG8_ASCLU
MYIGLVFIVMRGGNSAAVLNAIIITLSVSACAIYGAFRWCKLCLIPFLMFQNLTKNEFKMPVHAVSVFGEEKGPRESIEAICGFHGSYERAWWIASPYCARLNPTGFDVFFDMIPQKQNLRRCSDSKHEHHKNEEHSSRSSSCTRAPTICSSSNRTHSDRQEEVLIGDVDIVLSFLFFNPDVNE